MLFNSIEYFLLLLVAVPLFWAVPNQKLRLFVMLLASIVFYASWEPVFLLLLFGAIFANFLFTLWAKSRSLFFGLAMVTANLAILAYFKYANFVLTVGQDIADAVGRTTDFEKFSIILPLGISFFTFQLIAYLADVRRGVIAAERSLLNFSVFISFFPQLVAGPICRGSELLPQLREKSKFDQRVAAHGLLMLAVGLFLKLAIADGLAPFVDQVYGAAEDVRASAALVATIAFGVQILCDFWGYSTMALGTAFLFGIKLPANFNLPYTACSLQDFWRRWHMTLSTWLRDYLYIPLGGSRCGRKRTEANLLIVMGLGGLWHGASYNFVIWGLIHGSVLVVERELKRRFPIELHHASNSFPGIFIKCAGWLSTMATVFVAWIFFRAETVADAMNIIGGILSGDGWKFRENLYLPLTLLALFAVAHIPLDHLNKPEGTASLSSTSKIILATWLALGALILGSGETVPFIYFQF